MMKYNRLLSASVVLMLILAMPGMPDLVTKIYAALSVSELLEKYLGNHIFRHFDPLPYKGPSSSPQSPRSLPQPSDADPLPYIGPSSSPQSPRSALSESVQNTLVYNLKVRNQNNFANSNDAARWNVESANKIQF